MACRGSTHGHFLGPFSKKILNQGRGCEEQGPCQASCGSAPGPTAPHRPSLCPLPSSVRNAPWEGKAERLMGQGEAACPRAGNMPWSPRAKGEDEDEILTSYAIFLQPHSWAPYAAHPTHLPWLRPCPLPVCPHLPTLPSVQLCEQWAQRLCPGVCPSQPRGILAGVCCPRICALLLVKHFPVPAQSACQYQDALPGPTPPPRHRPQHFTPGSALPSHFRRPLYFSAEPSGGRRTRAPALQASPTLDGRWVRTLSISFVTQAFP